MAKVSLPAWMGRNLTPTKWISRYSCSGTRCTGTQSKSPWQSSSAPKNIRKTHVRPALGKEAHDELDRHQVAQSALAQRSHQGASTIHARAARGSAGAQLRRSEPGLQRGTGAAGGPALPGMREADVY